MKDIVLKRIEELGQEAAKLMQRRSHIEEAIREIETRLHQISGAITELDTIARGITDETSKNHGRRPAQSTSETSDATSTSQDGVQA